MTKRLLVFSLLFMTLGCSGQEKIKALLQRLNYFLNVGIPFSLWHARKYMMPKLGTCKTFAEIKNQLYEEEEEKLEKLFDDYAICKEDRKRLKAEFADLSIYNPLYRNDYYPEPDRQLHDEKTLGKDVVNATRIYLKLYGINPDAVRIDDGEGYFGNDSYARAHALAVAFSPLYGKQANIAYNMQVTNGVPLNASYHTHDIAHEAVHIVELHQLKKMLVDRLLVGKVNGSEIYKNPESVPASYLLWSRVQEKQAELFPLLDFGCSGVFDNFVNSQIRRCNWMAPYDDQWNSSDPLETHPQCTELLPYIVKIQDLEKQGAKPLIRRLDPSDFNLFEKD